jgi:hypothetical protein
MTMRMLLINPPHPSIGSRIPREQLPPLGLLSVGGPCVTSIAGPNGDAQLYEG